MNQTIYLFITMSSFHLQRAYLLNVMRMSLANRKVWEINNVLSKARQRLNDHFIQNLNSRIHDSSRALRYINI